MKLMNRVFAGLVATGVGLATTAAIDGVRWAAVRWAGAA